MEPGSAATLAARFAFFSLARVRLQANDPRATLDLDAVSDCIADLAEPRCFGVSPLEFAFDSCARITRGTQVNGDACEDTFQCVTGSCDFEGCTCAAGPARDSIDADALECLADSDCPDGETCDVADGGLSTLCVQGCASDVDCADGEICGPVPTAVGDGSFFVSVTPRKCIDRTATGCFADTFGGSRCGDGLECADNACGAPRAVGDACAFDCGDGPLFCDVATGQCSDARRAEGESCDQQSACEEGLNCVDGNCTTAPGLNEPCDFSQPTACGPGLFCGGTVCVEKGAVGDFCFIDALCSTRACDIDRLQCENDVEVGLGEDCSTSLCAQGRVCAGGVCADRVVGRELGASCSAGNFAVCPPNHQCSSGTCEPFVAVEEGACSSFSDFGPLCVGSLLSDRFCDVGPFELFGTCEDLPQTGEACPGFSCARDAFCDVLAEDGPVCAERSPLGGPCANDGSLTCDDPLFCIDGLCVDVAVSDAFVGEVCSLNG